MITVNKNDFLNAIKATKTSCAKAGLQPILNTIHLKSENGGLTLTATDCTNTTRAVIEANATEPIDICLNSEKLEAIVNRLDNEITIDIKDANAHISSGKLNYKLLFVNSSEFPEISFEFNENKVVLSVDEFRTAIEKTAFATMLDTNMSVLSGVCFTFNDTSYEVASTDGNRLSKIEFENPYINITGKYILPKKVLVDVAKYAKEEIEIYFDNQRVIFKTNNYLFASALILGEYPDYNKLLPEKQPNIAVVDKKVMLTALENVSIMSDDRTNIVTLDFKGNELELMTNSVDVGEAKDTIDVDFNSELKICFNHRYLVEVLKVIETDTIQFAMGTNLSPCLINSEFLHLIMPIQPRG